MNLEDQPPPKQTQDGPAAWDLVRERFDLLRTGERLGHTSPCHRLDVIDVQMGQRDALGLERYGTRLRPHNGRDNLVDAQQEALDLCAYLANEILETKPPDGEVDVRHDQVRVALDRALKLVVAIDDLMRARD